MNWHKWIRFRCYSILNLCRKRVQTRFHPYSRTSRVKKNSLFPNVQAHLFEICAQYAVNTYPSHTERFHIMSFELRSILTFAILFRYCCYGSGRKSSYSRELLESEEKWSYWKQPQHDAKHYWKQHGLRIARSLNECLSWFPSSAKIFSKFCPFLTR